MGFKKNFSSESKLLVFPHCDMYHIVVKYIDTSKQYLLTWLCSTLYSLVFLSDTILHNKSTVSVYLDVELIQVRAIFSNQSTQEKREP